MTGEYVEVSRLGRAYLPGRFSEAVSEEPTKCFAADDTSRDQLVKFLKRGGTLVITGEWQDIRRLREEILKREDELALSVADKRERVRFVRHLEQRMLTTLDSLPADELAPIMPDMPGLLGEGSLPDDAPTLIPIHQAEQLLQIPSDEHLVRAIDATVVAHPDVLVPASQETIDLMCEAIKGCEPGMPQSASVLDVGCGSGVLSIASWQLLRDKSPGITATDILPEASATTRLNWRRLSAIGKAGPEQALTTCSGCLFEPVEGQRFDLIIFNAPWVVAPARNRAELALNDECQGTVKAFLESCPDHLRPNGRVIVGYADNSGPKAISRLEDYISAAGLTIDQVLKDRIHTRRAKRQWQNIYAYVLSAAEPSK